jgi:hypothetical protein
MERATLEVTTPSRLPYSSYTGPPLFPGLTGAEICRTSLPGVRETIPLLMEKFKPSGWPIT